MLEAGGAAAEAGGVFVGAQAPSPGRPPPACGPLPHQALSRTLSHVLAKRPRAGPPPARRSPACLASRTPCARPTRRPVFNGTETTVRSVSDGPWGQPADSVHGAQGDQAERMCRLQRDGTAFRCRVTRPCKARKDAGGATPSLHRVWSSRYT